MASAAFSALLKLAPNAIATGALQSIGLAAGKDIINDIGLFGTGQQDDSSYYTVGQGDGSTYYTVDNSALTPSEAQSLLLNQVPTLAAVVIHGGGPVNSDGSTIASGTQDSSQWLSNGLASLGSEVLTGGSLSLGGSLLGPLLGSTTGGNILNSLVSSVLGNNGGSDGDVPSQINIPPGTVPVPPGMVCKAVDCYAQCKANDVAKTAACRQIQKEYLALMKTVGCKGAKCSMPAMAKTCKKPAKACKRVAKYTKCC